MIVGEMLVMWFWLGIVLAVSELVLPGLVVVFVGLAALTVALLMYTGVIVSLPAQLIAWFGLSIIYTLTLRMLVLHFYPTDTVKQQINDDVDDVGRRVSVLEAISGNSPGRIVFGESTWAAVLPLDEEAIPGQEVVITGRDGLTFSVRNIDTKVEST
jgi:membrane protein implicated in regulation of membrane protease activity